MRFEVTAFEGFVLGCQDVDAVLGRFGWGFLVPFRLFSIVWV